MKSLYKRIFYVTPSSLQENHNAFADGSHKCNSRPLALKPAGGMRDSALELQLFGFYYKQTQEQVRVLDTIALRP